MTGRQRIEAILKAEAPDRVIYSPNIWQWFYHHKNHGTLPDALIDCQSLVDAHIVLGADCFSRNLATDQRSKWYGGFSSVYYEGIEVEYIDEFPHSRVIYHTRLGDLTESFYYQQEESTLVQKKFLLDDPASQLPLFKELVLARHLNFDQARWDELESAIGDLGMNIFGEFSNPLKLFHFACNPTNTTYLICDNPLEVQEIMEIHTSKCLQTARQAIEGGVKVIMTMDNLDEFFFPPPYFEQYCRPFFVKLSELCHQHNVKLMSHACGRVKELLPLCIKAGLDGLEGITPPPLGNVELYEAIELTGGDFICNGGITPLLQQSVKTKDDVYEYTRSIFEKLKDTRQFVYSMSCNTSINTSYDVICWFRDATRELSEKYF
jgi:hypothetical protein